jgi:hypothetical protein
VVDAIESLQNNVFVLIFFLKIIIIIKFDKN